MLMRNEASALACIKPYDIMTDCKEIPYFYTLYELGIRKYYSNLTVAIPLY